MFSSSEVVVQQATRTLQSTHPALRHLRVEGSEGALVISGTVTCYYHKQLAQEALTYSAQLTAQARKLGLDAARKING